MAHDVFISYSSRDKPVADAVCATLEGRRVRCWVAPRDVLPGLPYGEAIVEAIETSRVLVLVFSASANSSPQVMREVERAVSKGIPIIPLRIEDVRPSKSLEYFISAPHWLDALTPPLARHLQSLGETVQLLLSRLGKRTNPPGAEPAAPAGTAERQAGEEGERSPRPTTVSARGAKPAPRPVPTLVAWGAATVVLLCAVAGVVALALSRGGTDTGRRAEATDPQTTTPSGKAPPPGETRKEAPPPKAPTPGEPYVNSVGMKFAWVPRGSFLMGGDTDDDEKPVHRVTITRGFYMGVYPVSQAEWKKVMDGDDPSNFKGDDLPVENVSWDDCRKFCERLRQRDGKPYRLPSEAEWEYACRAETTTEYYTGDGEDALKKAGWYSGNSGSKTHPVGQLAPNKWGLYDMHGNVWQWCHDWYGPYPKGDAIDQIGPEKGEYRVVRGGSWFRDPERCRAANRHWGVPGRRFLFIGCRVCFLLD
jgi:formylglycine-generating enzyme required for sulfatase activity